ncbi:LOW QUALITY PROTEIN: hypothetical protein JCM24511_09930 [Saitozyma sp. JCM 24511]|nr:LOW QUALITY PROTEIN: hypothetical protein JCM24511_09930 [Saitozyma sp. JCM 24511]
MCVTHAASIDAIGLNREKSRREKLMLPGSAKTCWHKEADWLARHRSDLAGIEHRAVEVRCASWLVLVLVHMHFGWELLIPYRYQCSPK